MPTASAPATTTTLLARYRTVRAATLSLIAPLTPEDLMVQSCPEASPAKWHLAHTSWFFETFVLAEFLPGYQSFHPDFRWLFNSYYNALGDMPEKKLRASFSRPPLDAILAFRTHVDAAIARLLEPAAADPLPDEALRRITLGLEHEQQHQELIATDIKHALFTNPLHPAYLEITTPANGDPAPEPTLAPPLDWTDYPGGLTEIGVPADPTHFAFDNESPRHTVFLQPFRLATRLITCSEYLAFLDDNGYTRPELWLSEGWARMREEGWKAPLYWQPEPATRSGWSIYTLHGTLPLEDLSETPVCHLSFFEADAFARWFSLSEPGCRLPTEFEWEHAALLALDAKNNQDGDQESTSSRPEQRTVSSSVAQRRDPCISPFAATANLLETANLHPTPAPSAPGPGLQQIFGDTWEWTASAYLGYPGYQPLPGALGEYNGKFMSSQMVLRGGSCVTPATHIRATYRNFFAPGTRWQFSGLRLAR